MRPDAAVDIGYLADHPGAVVPLARAFHAAWPDYYGRDPEQLWPQVIARLEAAARFTRDAERARVELTSWYRRDA